MEKRLAHIDILKALAILLVVMGHADAPFLLVIYMFHMQVFFMASGYCFRSRPDASWQDLGRSLLRRLRKLYLPFVLANTAFVLLHNVFLTLHIYNNDPAIENYLSQQYIQYVEPYGAGETVRRLLQGLLFSCGEPMGVTLWFLKILFLVTLLYSAADFLLQKALPRWALLIQGCLSAIALLFGWYCSAHDIWLGGLERTATCYSLYYLGVLLARIDRKTGRLDRRLYLLLLPLSLLALIFLRRSGTVILISNSYVNPVFLLACSLAGWCLLSSAAHLLEELTPVSRFLTTLGRHTLAVMLLHFLAMKPVALAVALHDGLPLICVAAFSSLHGGRGLLWLCYTAAGTLLPLAAALAWEALKQRRKTARLPGERS